jgi:uncharacterized protein (TIGR01777 family)
MESNRTIVMPGGAGYLGRHLASYFAGRGDRVVILTRHPKRHEGPIRQLAWDGKTLGDWAAALEGAQAVVNLAGRTVNCRYNAKHKREIYDSRLESTRVIGQAIAGCANPPAVWINSSSATIYRHALDRAMDEKTGEIGMGFSVDVCQKWEEALNQAAAPGTRKVALRTAIVFGPGAGGPFEAFRRVVKLGLGGTMGRGDQFVSWVHSRDFCRAVEFLIGRNDMSGPVNVASANPIPNREFMRIFRRVLHKRIGLPAARWMLEIGAFFLRTETELLLKSRWVVPGRLLEAGFEFEFPEFGAALENIVRQSQGSEEALGSCGLGMWGGGWV